LSLIKSAPGIRSTQNIILNPALVSEIAPWKYLKINGFFVICQELENREDKTLAVGWLGKNEMGKIAARNGRTKPPHFAGSFF
jgi:hypothetical protein